jgi:hypothetical protein
MASKPTRLHVNVAKHDQLRCVSLKIGYTTKAAALDVAEAMMREGAVNTGCHITPYLCGDCHEWHVWNRPITFR